MVTDHKVTNRGLRESAKTVGDGLATKRVTNRQSDEQTTRESDTQRTVPRKKGNTQAQANDKGVCDVRFPRRHVQKAEETNMVRGALGGRRRTRF